MIIVSNKFFLMGLESVERVWQFAGPTMDSVADLKPTVNKVLDLKTTLKRVEVTGSDPAQLSPDIDSVEDLKPDVDSVLDLRPTMKSVEEQ